MKKRLIRIALVLAFSTVITACGGGNNVETTSTEPEPIVSETIKEESQEPEVSEPTGPKSLLTNEITETDLSNKRPLAVMIENTKDALPHYGLCNAGIVYEAPAEGGITRYMGIFDEYEDYDRLGNVRSARPYYIYFAAEYDAIYAHVGQSDDALTILNKKIVDELNGLQAGEAYYRSNDKKMPHNAYLSSEGIYKDIETKKISTEYTEPYEGHFKFANEENLLLDGTDCKEVHIYFMHNKPYFLYDESTGLYTKYEFGKLEEDAYSDNGLTFTNLIFEEAGSKVVGSAGQLDIKTIGSGNGKFFTRGKMIDIIWEKKNEKAKTVYYMPDGSEIELNTGKTYIALIENAYKDSNTYE